MGCFPEVGQEMRMLLDRLLAVRANDRLDPLGFSN